MKVYLSVDMEGVAGVATLDQILRGGHGYARAQELMTQEANAAIRGAFDGGATSVTVNDSHGTMDNLLHDQLDPRARLVFGTPKAQCMAEGLTDDCDVALFIGYHAPAGARGVLAHTFSSHFAEVRVNGAPVSEAEVNGFHAASLGVPVGLVTGDDVISSIADKAFPGVAAVTVKTAHGYSAASSIAPALARNEIQAAAAQTVSESAALTRPAPPEHFAIEVDLASPMAAELVANIPGGHRTADRTVALTVPTTAEMIGVITVFYELAAVAEARRAVIFSRR